MRPDLFRTIGSHALLLGIYALWGVLCVFAGSLLLLLCYGMVMLISTQR